MLRSVKDLQSFQIVAADGAIGTVDQFFFDDERWTSSPDIDTHKPISRQHESDYLRHYGYPYYWGGAALWGAASYPADLAAANAAEAQSRVEAEQAEARARGDSHLRSSKEVIGYRLEAADGELGHIEDFLAEDQSWAIRYIVVDTSNWWFGRNVLVAPDWIREVSWAHRRVYVDLTRESVKGAPEYDSVAHIDRQWEADYHAHYRRPPYWNDPLSTDRCNSGHR